MINLSIIIPHYNSSKLLDKLLSTVPAIDEIEVIVIDDCSDELEFMQIQEMYKSSKYKFKLLESRSNQGAGTCRNIGLKNARGKWILFADSDDFFTESFYDIISPYLSTDNDVVFFMPTSVYIDTGELADRHEKLVERLNKYLENPNKRNELDLRYRFEVPWSKLISKDLIVKHNIMFEEVAASNDLMFSTAVGHYMSNFAISTDTIYVSVRNHYSLTVNKSEKIYDIRLKEKVKYFYFLKEILSVNELKILNISFLDFLLKSMNYGSRKFMHEFQYLYKYKLPILDKRLFKIKSLIKLIKTYIDIKNINKKYSQNQVKNR